MGDNMPFQVRRVPFSRSSTILGPALLQSLGVTFAMAMSGTAIAQDASEAPSLPAVEVVGTSPLPGLGIERNKLPYEVQTATDRRLRESSTLNMTEYMQRNLTGVNVNEVQGSPFQTDVTYRGFRASSLIGAAQGLSVFLDGVRVNEAFGDVINWDMLPEAAFASMTLVPGSNPIYGLNTLGGALAFTTKSGLTHPGFEGEVSFGSFGRKRIDLSYGLKHQDGWHSFIAGTAFDEQGWRDQSEGTLGNLFLKVGRDLGRTKMDLSLLAGRSRLIGNGLLPSYRFEDGERLPDLYQQDRSAVFTHPDRTKNRVTQLTFNVQHFLDNNTEVAAMAYYRNSRRDGLNGDINEDYEEYVEDCESGFLPDGTPVDPGCDFTREQGAGLPTASLNTTGTDQDGYGASVNMTRILDKHQLTVGATLDGNRVRFNQFEQEGTFTANRGVIAGDEAPELDAAVSGRSYAIGLFASDTWTMAPGTFLTASARFNHAQVTNTLTTEDGIQPQEQFTYNKFNPALGIRKEFGNGVSLFGNVSQSNRVPTVIELACADPTQPCRLPAGLQADPFLEQVVSRTVEVGARWSPSRDTALSAAIYRTVNRDDIIFLRAPGAAQLGYFDNFEKTRNQGVDLSADKRLGNVTLRSSYSYLHATYGAAGTLFAGDRNIEVTSGTRLAGLPRHTLKVGLDWRATPTFSVGGDVVATSSRVTQGNEDGLLEDPEPGEELVREDLRTGGFALFNLRASYRPEKRLELFGRINNVFDRRYETYGALAGNIFPNGQLIQPHLAAQDAGEAVFVAPGAPRSFLVGMRYRF
jgi:outer membrane receptor protein involved in Fe transport